MSTPVTLTPGTLPAGYCPSTYQQILEDFLTNTVATLPGTYNTFVYGSSTPAVSDQDKVWVKVDASNNLVGIYTYNGAWVRPHEVPPSSSIRTMWVGTTVALETFDGGTAGAVTATTGPMWEVDTAFDFRIPMGVGTNATTYDGVAATSLTVGEDKGAEKHKLVIAEMPAHTHTCGDGHNFITAGTAGVEQPDGTPNMLSAHPDTASTGGDLYHSSLPPVHGVYFIKRTARVYHVG